MQRIVSRRPPIQLDHTALARAFGRSRLPLTQSVEGRVALLAAAAEALLKDELPGKEARLFLGSALSAWLAQGGDLARDYLRIVRAKSHRTASRIFQEIQRENSAHQDEGAESDAARESADDPHQETQK